MKITKLVLYDHVKLKVSRIQEIEINLDQNIQLIIGSNGSGKSTILHELFPFPPVKSSFGRNGYKELFITHDGDEYKLVFDASRGHFFYRNEVNLNIGNTYDIQKDLIFEYFGIDNDIHTILKCSLPVCEMTPSQRKKILMNMNPIDISLFLEKYQKVHKDVIAYGNNLDRLYARQKQLMSKKIPEQQYQDMIARRSILDNQEKLLLMWITSVTTELNNLPHVSSIESIDQENIRSIYKVIHLFKDIKRESLSSKITELNVRIDMITQNMHNVESDMSTIIKSIDENESKKKIIENDVQSVSYELTHLKERIDKYAFSETFVPLSKESISDINEIATRLMDILVEITYVEYKRVLTENEVNNLGQEKMGLEYTINLKNNELNVLKAKHAEILKSIRIYSVAEDCSSDKCELFNVYNSNQKTKHDELNKITFQLEKLINEVDSDKKKMTEIGELYTAQVIIWNHIKKGYSLISSNVILKRKFDITTIVNCLNESPMHLYKTIIQYIRDSESYHEYVDIQKRIQELEIINASLNSKKSVSIEALENELKNQNTQLTSLRNRHKDQMGSMSIIKDELSVLHQFKNVKDTSHSLLNKIHDIESKTVIQLSREYLSNLLSILSSSLQNIRSELIDITTICKEQELLLARLDTEIDSVINDLKPKFEKAKIVEKSLALLPVKYTKNFINAIIETQNYFINEVMTYPMSVISVPENEECDFSFPVIIKDEVPAKDISLLSEGQKSIIQLAFNLAMVVELKFNRFPVYCDEYNRALDVVHSQRLTDMLLNLVKSGIMDQLFVVNHDRSMIEQLSHTGNVIVLDEKNIILPEEYNKNVRISYI